MKWFLYALLFINEAKCSNPVTVYICDSRNAVRYHYKEDCRGLSNCKYRIVETTLDSAQKSGKTLCKWEIP